MMGGGRILNDEQIDRMAELREAGKSYKQIARWFEVRGTFISPTAIAWQCLRVGADPLNRAPNRQAPRGDYYRGSREVRVFTPEDDALLLRLRLSGAGISEISRRMARATSSIQGRLLTIARAEARAERGFGAASTSSQEKANV